MEAFDMMSSLNSLVLNRTSNQEIWLKRFCKKNPFKRDQNNSMVLSITLQQLGSTKDQNSFVVLKNINIHLLLANILFFNSLKH